MLKYTRGDILKSTEPIIVHQVNCLCVKPFGLSNDIFTKYPYADVYSTRRKMGNKNLSVPEDRGTPGEIIVREDNTGPTIVGLFGQLDYGKPGKSCYHTTLLQDNLKLREEWFQTCLTKLKEYLTTNKHKRVAFPNLIGCGLGGGDWNVYKKMLQDFAKNSPFEVIIYIL